MTRVAGIVDRFSSKLEIYVSLTAILNVKLILDMYIHVLRMFLCRLGIIPFFIICFHRNQNCQDNIYYSRSQRVKETLFFLELV